MNASPFPFTLVRLLSVLILTLCVHGPAEAAANLWSGLSSGPHAVGFRSDHALDYSRPPLREQAEWPEAMRRGRYMQVGIWYPASASQGTPMGYWDYARLRGERLAVGRSTNIDEAALRSLHDFLLLPESINLAPLRSTPMPMRAVRDAPPAAGPFPTVVMIHNLDHYALYGEYLASHGYVVVAVPATGSFEHRFDFETFEGVEVEVRDAEYALSRIAQLSYVDPSRIAAFGHSYGAQSAVALAVRNPSVKAIVSLDGGIGSRFGAGLLPRMPYFSIAALRQPILHLWTRRAQGATVEPIDAYRYSERLYVEYPDARHIDFVLAGQVDALIGAPASARLGDVRGDVPKMARDMAERVLAFLDAHLTGKPARHRAYLADLGQTGTYRPSVPPPPSLEELRRTYEKGGLAGLLLLRDRARAEDPGPISRQQYLTMWTMMNEAADHAAALRWAEVFAQDFPRAVHGPHLQARSLAALSRKAEARTRFETAIGLLNADSDLTVEEKHLYLDSANRRIKELSEQGHK